MFLDAGIRVSDLLVSSKHLSSLSGYVVFEENFGLTSEFCKKNDRLPSFPHMPVPAQELGEILFSCKIAL